MKFRAAAMFTLHQINAFEDNGFLVMDMCCGDNGEVIADFTLENLRRESGEEMDQVNTDTFNSWSNQHAHYCFDSSAPSHTFCQLFFCHLLSC